MKTYKEIERRLDKIRIKSDIEIYLADEGWAFSCLNSPYVSHQNATFCGGHGIPRLLIFNNCQLLVHSWYEPAYDCLAGWRLEGNFVVAKLPARFITRIIEPIGFPLEIPDWLRGDVYVGYPDMFCGFEGGKPTFGKRDVKIIAINEKRQLRKEIYNYKAQVM